MVIPAPWSLPRQMRYQIIQALKLDAAKGQLVPNLSRDVPNVVILPKRATPMSQPLGR